MEEAKAKAGHKKSLLEMSESKHASSGPKHSKDAVDPKVKGGKCKVCDSANATVVCVECGNLILCEAAKGNGCDEDMHQQSGKVHHNRFPVQKVLTHSFSHMVVCYCCGQEFSVFSLATHIQGCPLKRKMFFRDIPAEVRPTVPDPPDMPIPGEHDSKSIYEAFNTVAKASYESCMCVCPHKGCGRRFEPDRIEIHMRGCNFRKK